MEHTPVADNNVEVTGVINESNGVVYNGYAEVVETTFYDTNFNTTKDTLTDTTVPKIEMDGTKMNTKQDTTIQVVATVQDISIVEATTHNTKEIEEMRDSIDGYRQVTFNPDDLQQVIHEQRQARIAGIPVSKLSTWAYTYIVADSDI